MSALPSPELGSLFEAALNEFEERTGTELAQHQIFNELVACESIEAVVTVLQEQIKALPTSPRDYSKLMNRIKRTVQIIHPLSTDNVVMSGANLATGIPPTIAVFAGIAILLSAIKDVDKSYNILVDLFESYESFLRRLDVYTKIPSTTAITKVITKILAELLTTISLATQQAKQGRLKKLGKKALGENDLEIEAILRRLDRLTLEEALLTGTTTLEVVYELLKNTRMNMDDGSILMDNIRRILVDMQQVESNKNKLRRDELQGKLRWWLSPPDPSVNHNRARNAHHEGSVEWFIHGKTFQQWKMGTGSLLWVQGKPGSGKSILSSSIIEDLKKSREAGLASIVFFYFDFKDQSKKNARGALSSLLVQLAAQSDSYSEILSALYSKYDAGSMQPSDDALKISLKRMLAIPGQAPIYIVIDALDECPKSTGMPSPRKEVLSLVKWLVELQCSNLSVSVTSRTETDIEDTLQPLASHRISLHDEAGQRKDITNYILWCVYSNPKWRKQDKELIIEKLSERAAGMFRWVFCQLDTLQRCIVSRIRHALDELPETLDETYERTLLDIDKEIWVYAHRLFQCLVVALRPLRVEELTEFLVFEFKDGGSPIFQVDCRPEDPRAAVLSTCSSLISIVNDDDGSAIVEFSHFSVKEYLTSTRIAEGRVPRYHTPLEPAHFLVTQACLSILLQQDDRITEEHTKNFPLIGYAAQYWMEHAKFGNALLQTEDMVKRLFDPRNPHFAPWISIYNQYSIRSNYSRPTPLYHAALFDLCGVAEWLVNTHSQNINTLGGDYGTALHAACATGSLGVAQFLLMCHADGNRVSDDHTLFYVASEGGQVTAPQVLHGQGADINAINDDGDTPLTVALKHGPMKTLIEATNLLLSHGANLNLTREGQSPIYAALSRGRHDAVRLLQGHGADPNTWDDGGKTLLHAASEAGDLKVAQGLLELGADINSRDNQGRTPLHVIQLGSEDVGLLLLEHGADPNVQDDHGETPLHVASREGNLKFARLLLEFGVDVNSRDNHTPTPTVGDDSHRDGRLLSQSSRGWTPLHVASAKGKYDVARVLLECDADVNALASDHHRSDWTPLHFASQQGHVEVVQLLLNHRADVLVCNDENQTALHLASQNGNSKLMRLLIDHDADSNAEDEDNETPLFQASKNGRVEATRLLLECGATVNHRDWQKRTPLHAASENGRVGVARLLLDYGAEVDAQNVYSWTPLHLGSWTGNHEVVEILLDRGAEANAQNDSGWTPLHMASQKGHLDIVRLLLSRGAIVDTREVDGETALHLASYYGYYEIAEVLLKFNADRAIKNKEGKTPFDLVTTEDHTALAQLLILPQVDEELVSGAVKTAEKRVEGGEIAQ